MWPGAFQWVCYGQPLEWAPWRNSPGPARHACYLHGLVWGAWALLQQQYGQLQCAAFIKLLLKSCKTCVPPTGLYGSEVWGPYRLSAALSPAGDLFGLLNLQILKQNVVIRSTVATGILLKELHVHPFENASWLRAVRFWTDLTSLPEP